VNPLVQILHRMTRRCGSRALCRIPRTRRLPVLVAALLIGCDGPDLVRTCDSAASCVGGDLEGCGLPETDGGVEPVKKMDSGGVMPLVKDAARPDSPGGDGAPAKDGQDSGTVRHCPLVEPCR
jgi:hypothetical protein